MSSKAEKQFDLSHLQIDERLQGAKLASFSRRLMAFALDWAIISLATQYIAWGILILMIYLFIRGKAMQAFQEGRNLIDQTVNKMDTSLEKFNANQTLKRQFVRYSRIYIHAMIILTFIASIGVIVFTIVKMLNPEQLAASANGATINFLATPFEGFYNVIHIFGGALGGLFYFSLFTWKWQGQTPGKRIMGIRVIKLSCKPISLWNSFERASGYTSSASLFLMGFFQCLWERNHQTTHDKICESIVIVDTPAFAEIAKGFLKEEKRTPIAQKVEKGSS